MRVVGSVGPWFLAVLLASTTAASADSAATAASADSVDSAAAQGTEELLNNEVLLPASTPAADPTLAPTPAADRTTPTVSILRIASPAASPAAPPAAAVGVAVGVGSGPGLGPVTRTTTIRTTSPTPAGRSLGAGLGLSLLLPGAGHQWMGYGTRGRAFIWGDALLWGGLLATYSWREQAIDDARSYASRYAGARHAPRDPEFLELMADYRSRNGNSSLNSSPLTEDDYNQSLLREGRAVDEVWPNDAAHDWDWGSPENPANDRQWENYRERVRDYRTAQISLQAVVGALLLDRLLAMADLLRLHRSSGGARTAGATEPVVPVQLGLGVRPDGSGINLALQF